MSDSYQSFRQAVERPEEQVDLARAALTIALDDYPSLDINAYLARLDQLAVEVTGRMDGGNDTVRTIAALNIVLFKEQGFHANRENYFDPKNSFLNEVLDRKIGIPITLSLLYMEVAQRVGLPLCGVSFPGHFLVKHVAEDAEIVLDPFNQGEIKSPQDLIKLLAAQYGSKVALRAEFLEAASKKQILKRMLNNLKVIYLRDDQLLKALPILERIVILDPAAADDIRDRGAIYLRLECFQQARDDFERYLNLAPDASDARAVREKLIDLTKQVSQIH